ncbi:hypothetical protein, partial [Halalkalibacter lacteus]|uniref:hypothetical protein n=1 Tax=Halalkalibacter lacteus TaxID=3090663 RepID=UPI002FC855C3
RGDPGLEPACREVLPCLREHLVIRHDHAIAFLRRVDVQRWGRPDDEIYRTAHANMQAEASTGISLVSRHPSPIWRVEVESDHDGSRLLIPGFL